MKSSFAFILLIIGLCLLAPARPLAVADVDSLAALPPSLVTADVLESRIAEARADPDLTGETRAKLEELYRKALSQLQLASTHAKAAAEFSDAMQTLPAQIQALQAEREADQPPPPLEGLTAGVTTPLIEIEQLLQKEQATLAAVDARRADIERSLAYQQNRPAAINQRLAQARQEQQELVAAFSVPATSDEIPALSQARRWVLDTRYAVLSAEISMLDQELLSHAMQMTLLRLKRDSEARHLAWTGKRVEALGELVNRKRQLEAEQSKREAEAKQRETAGLDPLLGQLANQNADLTANLKANAARLDALDREERSAAELADRIEADYQDIKATLESAGLTEGLGQLLVRHRKSLPDYRDYARRARIRERQIAEVGVQRLRYREEARHLADLEQTVAEYEAKLSVNKTPQLRQALRELLTQRRILLQQALEADEFYLQKLRELHAAERKLMDALHSFDTLLQTNLFWLRSAEPTGLEQLNQLPQEIKSMLSPSIWTGIYPVLRAQLLRSPWSWLALLVALTLLWKRRALIADIEDIATQVGKAYSDSFFHTLRVMGLMLLAIAPWPLVVAVTGWQLQLAEPGTELIHAMGVSLVRVAMHIAVLGGMRIICLPRGLAAAHFRWPDASLQLLRRELDWLFWIYIPMALIIRLAIDLNPADNGGTLARLCMLIGWGAISQFLFRVLHPTRGVLMPMRSRQAAKGLVLRSQRIWFPLLLAYPPAMVVLVLAGYTYSASVLSLLYLYTLWMVVALVLLYSLGKRWLFVTHRHLAYEAAVARRQAALAAGETTESEEVAALKYKEPEVDLAAISDESRALIKTAMIATGLIGLYLIWSSVFPALRVFEDVSLWHYTVTVAGEEQQLPVTLADLGLALIYALGIGVLAKRLPSVLEIILLRRFDLTAASRYTVTSLVNYAIIVVGILIVLNTIGAQWAQLQWLVAALGVGIGFGLQEIVANFISGLIILFERPIRVGDVVTVGDTDGVVTKIRIRATTIRGWDHKELIVPNKEFVTGRLLNWTLTDPITRINVVVGVAYGSDVDKALALMKEAAAEHERVLVDPAPILSFEGFGDNSLTLILRACVVSIDYRLATMTDLHKAIKRKFEQAGIVIAFPQRDVHFYADEPLRVSIEPVSHTAINAGNPPPDA